MDKKTIMLVVALGVLVIFWVPMMTYFGFIKPPEKSPVQEQTAQQSQTIPDSTAIAQTTPPETSATPPPSTMPARDENLNANVDQPLDSTLPADTVIIETNVWQMVMSTVGGGPVSLKLKEYGYYHTDSLVEMLPECQSATPSFAFNNGTFQLNRLPFQVTPGPGSYSVTSSPKEISFRYAADHGGVIVKTYRFYPDKYYYDLKITAENAGGFKFDNEYVLEWRNKLLPTEPNKSDDYNNFWGMAQLATEREKYDDYDDDKFSLAHDGQTRWIAKRSKFFSAIILPRSKYGTSAIASGSKFPVTDDGKSITARELQIGLEMETDAPMAENFVDSFSVYVGPVDYDNLKNLNPEVADLLDIGTTPYIGWIIKIFAVPIMWLLPRMYDVIPNYGFVILIFALAVKLITLPLSKKMVHSMSAMRELQPKIEELKKKHKNNPQAMNREMMKMYKEAGVNPLSGCLPYLPQLPLFFAMFAVFRTTILLRQAPFILWWDDLSRGAQSVTDPYIVLVLLMVGLMFVQQKMTMTDPKNKAMMYMMPLVFGFFFYRASAGLVLYWTSFSFFQYVEQLVFKRPTPAVAPSGEVQPDKPRGKKKK